MCGQSPRSVDDETPEQLNNTGIREPPADNEDQRDNDGRRVTETGERLLLRHDARQERNQQGDERDQVVTPAPPDEEHKNEKQEHEENALFGCHTLTVPRYDRGMGILVVIVLILALVFVPGIWVRRVLDRYSEPTNRYSSSGAELARHLLNTNGLEAVAVESSEVGDHYDPAEKAVRLTPDKYDGRSLTAITVAAHEVGHAVQDSLGYGPLRLRSQLVRVAGPIQKLGAGVLMASPFIGAITRVPQLGIVMFAAGFLTLATTTLVHLVTLPTEFDASFGRALPMLDEHAVLKPVDRPHARKLLTAAALTYVAASLMSLLNIARWWAILRR